MLRFAPRYTLSALLLVLTALPAIAHNGAVAIAYKGILSGCLPCTGLSELYQSLGSWLTSSILRSA